MGRFWGQVFISSLYHSRLCLENKWNELNAPILCLWLLAGM